MDLCGITDIIPHNVYPIGSELTMPLHTNLTTESREFGNYPFYNNVGVNPQNTVKEVHTILWRMTQKKTASRVITTSDRLQITLACSLQIYAPIAANGSCRHMQSGRTLVSMSTKGH